MRTGRGALSARRRVVERGAPVHAAAAGRVITGFKQNGQRQAGLLAVFWLCDKHAKSRGEFNCAAPTGLRALPTQF